MKSIQMAWLRRIARQLLVMLFAAAPLSAWSQDPDYILRVGDLDAPATSFVEVPVYLDNFGGGIQGWSMGVAHDPSELTLFDVEVGATSEILSPAFLQIEMLESGWTVGVVISSVGFPVLEAGLDYELHRPIYYVDADPGQLSSISFSDSLGVPPVSTVVVVGGTSVVPTQVAGSVTALDPGDGFSLVISAEHPLGSIDSASVIADALTSNGENVYVTSTFPTDVIPALHSVWVAAGTWPRNHVLSAAEGQWLADTVQAGTHVYVESGEAWGMDPLTAFADYDGVDGAEAGDGDDTFEGMIGLNYRGALLSGLDADYDQESPGDDSTDQLTPSLFDAAGPLAGTIWSDSGSGGSPVSYDTGIFYDTDSGFGKVIVQSWELGGYGGDSVVLVRRYATAFGLIEPNGFVRGDANGDGTIDIADPLFIESELFLAGSSSPCRDASDSNDDGFLDIADSIFLLSYLFVSGSPPPAPGPISCGSDATGEDLLDCSTYDCP